MTIAHKQQAQLERLKALAERPEEQVSYALEMLAPGAGISVVQPALRVLAGRAGPEARPVLLRQYAHYATDGVKRDPGTGLRVALLNLLRPLVLPADIPLLDAACMTYEFLPPTRAEAAAELRAAAMIVLDDLDGERAAYHAVRLLADKHTSHMSGEPGLTAARILAARERMLPLYYYAVHSAPGVSEVMSECLRSLTPLPDALLAELVERFGSSDDEIVLAGLFDLLLEHEAGPAYHNFVLGFLRTTRKYDVYRYLVTTIVAAKKHELLPELLTLAADENDPRKMEILADALSLVRADPAVEALLRELRERA
ncbi:MAG: hypothetical protein ACR2M0_00965 [Chloroflexia bacterium]